MLVVNVDIPVFSRLGQTRNPFAAMLEILRLSTPLRHILQQVPVSLPSRDSAKGKINLLPRNTSMTLLRNGPSYGNNFPFPLPLQNPFVRTKGVRLLVLVV